jgi:hypothetical protein
MLAQRIDERTGWHALADVATVIGVVPLVAVGPGGVFAIDLAAVARPRDCTLADVPERGLIHAWAQAKHLERRRVGTEVHAVLALPGGPTGRRRGVHVLPYEQVDAWLAARPPVLSADAAELLLSRLLQDTPQALLLVA